MSDTMEIGLNSFRELSLAFSASVFGTNGGVSPYSVSQMTCGDASASASENENSLGFFLDFSSDHKCAGSDWIVVLIMAILVSIVSWWGRWFVWEPIAELRMQGKSKQFDPSTKTRFGMTLTSILFHTTSAFCVFKLLTKTEWLWSPKEWSANIQEGTIEPDFKFYYLLYLSRYCSDSINMFFEDRRKDQFLQMLYHHIVTIGLVACSCLGGYTRFGGVIMFIFDWADLPLLSAKACKYLSLASDDMLQYVANRLFEVFAVVYTLTRSGMYNFIVYTALRDLPSNTSGNTARTLLVMLAALQTFWLTLLYKAVRKQIANGGNVEDIREDRRKEE